MLLQRDLDGSSEQPMAILEIEILIGSMSKNSSQSSNKDN